jgi:hypothetical protein
MPKNLPMSKHNASESLLLLVTAAGAIYSFSQSWVATGVALATLALFSGFSLANKSKRH